jgi:arginine deiminase
MAANTDEKAQAFLARWIKLEEERLENATDRKELVVEMKSAELLKEEIAGIKLAGKRHFEDPEKRVLRESAEEFAAALGAFASSPLGNAAIMRETRRQVAHV